MRPFCPLCGLVRTFCKASDLVWTHHETGQFVFFEGTEVCIMRKMKNENNSDSDALYVYLFTCCFKSLVANYKDSVNTRIHVKKSKQEHIHDRRENNN